jgi:thiol-disulfide isomerase/thioredoxin
MRNKPYPLTLYGRVYCSLCQHMLQHLQAAVEQGLVSVRFVDVDEDEALIARYDELVPVLVDEQGEELCHWHFDDAAFSAYLARMG